MTMTDDDTVTLHTIGKQYDTWQHRKALAAIGLTWNPESKAWETFDREQHTLALAIVNGRSYTHNAETGEVRLMDLDQPPTELPKHNELELHAALKSLGGGSIGFDPCVKSKAEKIAFGVAQYGIEALTVAILSARDARRKATSADVPGSDAPAIAKPVAPVAPALPGAAPDLAEAQRVLRALIGTGALDEARVREIASETVQNGIDLFAGVVSDAVDAAMANVKPHRVELSVANGPAVDVTGCHPMLPKVVALVSAGLNVLLVGPAGSGKTHLAADVARVLGKSFGSLSLSAGITESALTGRLLPIKDGGAFGYVPSPFVTQYETGGVFLLDEMDAADPNMLLIVNSATSNGEFEVEQRAADGGSTRVVRHPGTVIIGAANTFGTGATATYVGRSALDGSTLDRWYIVAVDYDAAYEARLCGLPVPDQKVWAPVADSFPGIVELDVRKLGEWVQALRKKAGANRIVSTRMLAKAAAARRAGVPVGEVMRDLLAGWSADELRAAGVAL